MIPSARCAQAGAALVIVLWIIMVLSLLISGFAFTMHVETKVASYSRKELKAELLARAGVEVAKMELLLHDRNPAERGFDALNQGWVTNSNLFVDHELGAGKFNVTITDEERKLPINQLSQDELRRLMALLEVDLLDADTIVDSILDWIDPNDLHRLNGAESDYYMSLNPPYRAKDGPLDRIEELLLVRGVTPELFEGAPATEDEPARAGLRDLLTTYSAGQININTASALVLQVITGLDETQIAAVLDRRDGQDGVPGTEDDMPYRSPAEFINSLGTLPEPIRERLGRVLSTSSQFFRIQSTGDVSGVRYTIDTIVRRQGGQCLSVTWTERRGG
jgi:general secretion pathway protein K